MKGLILKDLYMAAKYCRAYALIALVFLGVSVVNGEDTFFLFYPCLLCGMIPANLLAYDERSKWLQYSATLPYSKAQIVSAKYVIGLMAQLVVLIATGIARSVQMRLSGNFNPAELVLLLETILLLSAFASSIAMPFMFRWGVEKGRIAYYVMIGVVCAGAIVAKDLIAVIPVQNATSVSLAPALCIGAAVLYGLSWLLSIRCFQTREL